jgi:putative flippase GtrA
MVVLLSNILSWVCAFLFAFITNKLWVFGSKSWKPAVCLPELGKFFSARALTGVLEIIAVPLLVSLGLNQTVLGVEGMVAKVIVSVVVVVLNYIFSKLFVFKKTLESQI